MSANNLGDTCGAMPPNVINLKSVLKQLDLYPAGYFAFITTIPFSFRKQTLSSQISFPYISILVCKSLTLTWVVHLIVIGDVQLILLSVLI